MKRLIQFCNKFIYHESYDLHLSLTLSSGTKQIAKINRFTKQPTRQSVEFEKDMYCVVSSSLLIGYTLDIEGVIQFLLIM